MIETIDDTPDCLETSNIIIESSNDSFFEIAIRFGKSSNFGCSTLFAIFRAYRIDFSKFNMYIFQIDSSECLCCTLLKNLHVSIDEVNPVKDTKEFVLRF